MGTCVDFPGTNVELSAPEGMENEVYTITAFRANNQFLTCWELTEEELAEIVSSKKVWLSTLGSGFSPAFVGSQETVLRLIFGVSQT